MALAVAVIFYTRYFSKLALKPGDVVPSIELPADGSKGTDVVETYAAV